MSPAKIKDTDLHEDFEVNRPAGENFDPKTYLDNYRLYKSILAEAPENELIKRGWIEKDNINYSLISLFNNIQQNNLKGLCRKANTSNNALCAIWQTRILTNAQLAITTQDISPFDGINIQYLREIVRLSPNPEVILELPNILAQIGIVLIYERSLPAMKLDGVVFKIANNQPVIGLSFRYKRLDYFWFTLLHELAHIALHFGHLNTPIFDDMDEENTDILELQANKVAKDAIADKWKWRNCKAKYTNDEQDIIEFAQECEVHPALIAGLLQREKNAYQLFRKITDQIDVREMVFGDE
ncbi:ImmA/IrrE family metallo-endopeptidase [Desulfogranum japonicum]|uniref:ImmA/IrrE family metallo-endopeptidase n=1 Tax=Desulfogranum japonicum TaxID=231447 RepID=UPI000410C0F7|nr:ImmA/IrrE family metallo-endopeptidase [Desulfogranum japonicum]